MDPCTKDEEEMTKEQNMEKGCMNEKIQIYRIVLITIVKCYCYFNFLESKA